MAKGQQKRWQHTVEEKGGGSNFIDYCVNAFPILGSKSAVKKAIATGRLKLNGQIPTFKSRLKKGDRISLEKVQLRQAKAISIELPIVFEDEHLIIVNKPGGIAVNGNRNKTVENILSNRNKENKEQDALPGPVAIHRIDVPTSGLVMLAKTKQALIKMSKAFQENKVQKEYQAVVHGETKEQGTINQPIAGKKAITHFEKVKSVPSRIFKQLSLVKLKPITGRTHQLRIHMKDQGHLIVGDKQYAEREKTILGKGMMLCARQLEFEHPVSKKPLNIEIDYPTKFDRILQREAGRFS